VPQFEPNVAMRICIGMIRIVVRKNLLGTLGASSSKLQYSKMTRSLVLPGSMWVPDNPGRQRYTVAREE